MSPASSRWPSSVETRRATWATSARPQTPMSPTPITVTVSPVWPPPPPVPPPSVGPEGEAQAAARPSNNSRRYGIGPLLSFTIRGTVSPPLHNDSGVPQTGQGQSDGPLAAGAIDDGRSRRGARAANPGDVQGRLRARRDRSARGAHRRQRRHSRPGARPHLGAAPQSPLYAGIAEPARQGAPRAVAAHARAGGSGIARRSKSSKHSVGPGPHRRGSRDGWRRARWNWPHLSGSWPHAAGGDTQPIDERSGGGRSGTRVILRAPARRAVEADRGGGDRHVGDAGSSPIPRRR